MGYRWVHADPLPGGHTLYTRDNGDMAIGDRSGATPEQTDDGVLWLDLGDDRTPMWFHEGREVHVPVITDEDKLRVTTPMSLTDFLLIADKWGNEINVRGVMFTMMRSTDVQELRDEIESLRETLDIHY